MLTEITDRNYAGNKPKPIKRGFFDKPGQSRAPERQLVGLEGSVRAPGASDVAAPSDLEQGSEPKDARASANRPATFAIADVRERDLAQDAAPLASNRFGRNAESSVDGQARDQTQLPSEEGSQMSQDQNAPKKLSRFRQQRAGLRS